MPVLPLVVITSSLPSDPVILQKGSALRGQRIEAAVRVVAAEACLQAAVAPAHARIASQVAGDARCFVEDGTQTVGDALLVHEMRLPLREQIQLLRGEPRQRIAGLADGDAQLVRAGRVDQVGYGLRRLLL